MKPPLKFKKKKKRSLESCLVGEYMDVLRRWHAWGGDGRSTPLPPHSMPCASLPLDFLNCIFYHKLVTTGKLLSCVLWVMLVNHGDRGRDCGKFWICSQSGTSVGCLGSSLWLLSEMGTVSRDWVLTLWGLCKLWVVIAIIELNCQAIGWYQKADNWLLILEKETTDPRSVNRWTDKQIVV